jgi:hypothetical protein
MMRNTMSFVKLATFRVNCFWLEWKHIFLEIWPVFTPKVLFLHTQVCSELNLCYFLMKFFLDGWDGSPQIPSKLTTRWMREVISSRMHVCHNSFTFWQRAPLPLPCSDVGSKVIKHNDTRARVSNFSTRTSLLGKIDKDRGECTSMRQRCSVCVLVVYFLRTPSRAPSRCERCKRCFVGLFYLHLSGHKSFQQQVCHL